VLAVALEPNDYSTSSIVTVAAIATVRLELDNLVAAGGGTLSSLSFSKFIAACAAFTRVPDGCASSK
jgi:hypothetical protein